jgi:SAM-dependent methyltransferase
LEVGIGVGGIADHVARKEECELVGIDLSYAADSAYKHFGGRAFLHIVQASAFAPPFPENVFDLVYSQGVLHHTFSTKTAFEHICKLPKVGGRLYVWVYSEKDEQRTMIRRIIMLMETLIRPLCWRLPESLQTVTLLPIIPLYLIHQNLQARCKAGYVRFGWREAMHAARDRFTPRYVHRHTEEEICDWFRQAGYAELQCASKRDRPNFVPIPFVSATAVDGVRFRT